MKLVVLALWAAMAGPATAQEVVQLEKPRDIVRDGAAMPRIVAPATPATAAINRAFRAQDRSFVRERAECLTQVREAGRGMDFFSFARAVRASMLGPEFVAVVTYNGALCATAYEAHWTTTATYDLKTGIPVDWPVLAPGAAATGETGAVKWPRLHKLYLAKVEAGIDAERWTECRDALDDPEATYLLLPDAEAGGLEVTADHLPHVAQACAEPVVLDADEMRALGVAPRLVEAIAAAHAAKAFQPDED